MLLRSANKMKRGRKATLFVGAIGLTIAIACFVVFSFVALPIGLLSESDKIAQEITDLEGHLTHLDPSIRVIRGFYASSYEGLHGDGESVKAYIIDTEGIDALIAGLKRFHAENQRHDYKWFESTRADIEGLESLLPKEFRPQGSKFVVTRRKDGRIIIGPEHGVNAG